MLSSGQFLRRSDVEHESDHLYGEFAVPVKGIVLSSVEVSVVSKGYILRHGRRFGSNGISSGN